MSGKFNPFQSKESEVLRTHTVTKRSKALKIFAKLQEKRPYSWVELRNPSEPAALEALKQLSGETSVALFIDAISDKPICAPLQPALNSLIDRLWSNFNKLHLIQRVPKQTFDAANGTELDE